ncbi:MAG TPA: hypothetical protein PKA41_18940 [Verrucomicrobiota bacterium]|nr:hypothetical protein [Verrucomicrobiota bacterium]
MKTQSLAFYAPLVAAFLLFLGCATPDSGSYTLKQTRLDVETAMQRYRNANVAGGVTTAEQQQVNAAHVAFQRAFNEAFARAGSNINAPTPLNVRELADKLTAAIDTIPE